MTDSSSSNLVAELREQAGLVDRPYADELMREAADKIERLTAERNTLQKAEHVRALEATEDRETIRRLWAALERYGRHESPCLGSQFDPVTCSTVDVCVCGFNAALASSSVETTEKHP